MYRLLSLQFLILSNYVSSEPVEENVKGSVRYVPPNSVEMQPKVLPLIEGIMYPTDNGYFMTGSVTLIADQGFYIIFDSPSGTDQLAKDQMLKSLNALSVLPHQIHVMITSHGHPDHFGQNNFFANAEHFFGPYQIKNGVFKRTDLFTKNEIRLTQNTELWNTAGHTNNDISLIVRNVPDFGTVAVVGDLFYSELDALSDSEDWKRDALDGQLGSQNRRRVLCVADAIVPGHSKMFRVSPEMRKRNGCPQILSIAGSTNDVNTFRSDPQPAKQPETPTVETIKPTVITLPLSLQQNATTLAQSRLYATQTLANPAIPLPTEAQRLEPPVSLSLPQQTVYPTQQLPLVTQPQQQQPLLSAEAIQSLQQTVLMPFLESTAANLANYLTAAQGGVPIPQISSTQVHTTYPTLYPPQLQMLPRQQKKTRR